MKNKYIYFLNKMNNFITNILFFLSIFKWFDYYNFEPITQIILTSSFTIINISIDEKFFIDKKNFYNYILQILNLDLLLILIIK